MVGITGVIRTLARFSRGLPGPIGTSWDLSGTGSDVEMRTVVDRWGTVGPIFPDF